MSTQLSNSDMQIAEVAEIDDDREEERRITPPPLPGTHHKRIKSAKGKLNLALFSNIQPEVVDNIPWDVNGNNIYAIPTMEEFWHGKQMDRTHWAFTTSFKKGLDGKRKFETFQGSLICMNPQCPVFTTEQIRNQIDFVKHEFEGHACNSCGYLATRISCGCIKVIEFNRRGESPYYMASR